MRLVACGAWRAGIRWMLGDLLNMLGLPGFIREYNYGSRIGNGNIKVRISPFYTIITVNGLDVYFNRWSGRIDGTGRAI